MGRWKVLLVLDVKNGATDLNNPYSRERECHEISSFTLTDENFIQFRHTEDIIIFSKPTIKIHSEQFSV
jgi:hypothetical protein